VGGVGSGEAEGGGVGEADGGGGVGDTDGIGGIGDADGGGKGMHTQPLGSSRHTFMPAMFM